MNKKINWTMLSIVAAAAIITAIGTLGTYPASAQTGEQPVNATVNATSPTTERSVPYDSANIHIAAIQQAIGDKNITAALEHTRLLESQLVLLLPNATTPTGAYGPHSEHELTASSSSSTITTISSNEPQSSTITTISSNEPQSLNGAKLQQVFHPCIWQFDPVTGLWFRFCPIF